MPNVALFYISYEPGPDKTPVRVGEHTVYIRAEATQFTDLGEALAFCEPRDNESVMNSHYVTQDDDAA